MSPEGNYSDTSYAGPCISFRPSPGMNCGITHGAISYELIFETNPETLTLLINPHNNFTVLDLFRIS
jgi:hypothetical protein